MHKLCRPQILFALLALMICTGTVQAANSLQANATSITLNCLTSSGASANVTVKSATALTSTNTINVTIGTLSGGVTVSPTGAQTLNSTNSGTGGTGIVYTFSLPAGCAGVTQGLSQVIQFKTGTTTVANDITVTAVEWANATLGTNLAAIPGTIALSCSTATGPGSAQTVTIKAITPPTGTTTIPVTFSVPAAVTVVTQPAAPNALTSSVSSLTYTFALASCAAAPASSYTLQFLAKIGSANPINDAATTANTTFVNSASGLVVSPGSVTVTCAKNKSGGFDLGGLKPLRSRTRPRAV